MRMAIVWLLSSAAQHYDDVPLFFGVVNVNPTLMGMIDRMCNPCDMQMGFNGGVM